MQIHTTNERQREITNYEARERGKKRTNDGIKDINNSKQREVIGVIYRPNSQPKADMDIFVTTLNEIMSIIDHESKKCIVMGDMNIDLLSYPSNPKTNSYSTKKKTTTLVHRVLN